MRTALRLSLALALVFPVGAATQERVDGPPPEIRALIDGFVKGVNGDNAAFEAMAKAHFSTGYLARQTAAERAQLAGSIRKQFGTITRDRVIREGPDEPLQLHVKGSTGAIGVIHLSTDPASPFKISNIAVDVGAPKAGGGRGDRSIDAPIDASMTNDALAQALDRHLGRLAAEDTLSGAVLVARDGRPIFTRAYGYADRSNRIPNTIETRFNIGSINKKFTQIAIAQLIAAGKLSSTTTLGSIVPDYPQEPTRPATIAQLLGHTAGIADFFGDEFARTSKDRFRSNADYFNLVSRQPPRFAPGARNEYCNGCYITLGAIIERVSGVPYERYVAERIFTPAGMSHTGYPQTDAIEPGLAIGYTRRLGDGTLRSNIFAHGAAGSAAGGGYSTVGDLLSFANALRDGRIPGADTRGLGIAGGAPGTNAVLESNPTWTVAVLTNLDPPSGESIGTGIMAALSRGKG